MIIPENRIQEEDFTSIAFRADPKTVGALIPEDTIGAYVLFDGDRPVYVGRSDGCLRKRLMRHEHLPKATHVMWASRSTPLRAYHLEASWYHEIQALSSAAINKIHPAQPKGGPNIVCPFCGHDYEKALRRVLPYD
jgi:hypothetical protein